MQPQARGSRRRPARRTFQQEVVDLHRAIFRANQQRINESVVGYTRAFQRYEREYARSVRRFQRRANSAELGRAIARADIIYVGDYHTLPQAQRAFLRVLRRIPANRPLTVGLEFVQGRHQKAIDTYLKGPTNNASDNAFLRAIDHESHWVFGGWSSFKPIFELCRDRGARIIGIDSVGHGPAGSSLEARDRYAARRISRVIRDDPKRVVAILVGELHLAPDHLPKHVDEMLARHDLAPKRLILFQNCQEFYWQLERRGLEHDVELVQIAADQYCMMNTPPIVCQQSFLNWLDLDVDDNDIPQLEAPEVNFKEYARLIATFFDLPIRDELDEVELATVVDLSFLARLRRRGDFSPSDIQKIRRQILRSESLYIPRARMVYLGNLSVNHAAEEATHFLRHVCAGSPEPKMLLDAFYVRCLEETLGFLGSKLINHKRKGPSLAWLERQARSGTTSHSTPKRERRMARLVLKHLRMETGVRVRGMSQVYECDADMFNAVTHILGYRLGDRLYYGLVHGQFSKQDIRERFFDTFEEEGSALATYLYLIASTAEVKLPERL